jgi:hypothetical protein
MLHGWLRHECPVLIVSPEDAKVEIDHPGVECRWAGKRGWAGWHTLDRQIAHLSIIEEYSQTYFLYNDADSFCLSAKLPEYLYQTDTFFSNENDNLIFYDTCKFLAETLDPKDDEQLLDVQFAARFLIEKCDGILDIPKLREIQSLVFQPPYFFNRQVLSRMLDSAEASKSEDNTLIPFIDWWWPRVIELTGTPHQTHPAGKSDITEMRVSIVEAYRKVKEQGCKMVHSITKRENLDYLIEAAETGA